MVRVIPRLGIWYIFHSQQNLSTEKLSSQPTTIWYTSEYLKKRLSPKILQFDKAQIYVSERPDFEADFFIYEHPCLLHPKFLSLITSSPTLTLFLSVSVQHEVLYQHIFIVMQCKQSLIHGSQHKGTQISTILVKALSTFHLWLEAADPYGITGWTKLECKLFLLHISDTQNMSLQDSRFLLWLD